MRRIVIMLAFVLVLPVFAWANGPHDSLTCNGCHGIHTAKDNQLIFAVKANTADKASGVSALCLGCHSTKGNGMGIRPVESTHSHPWGVSPNPKRAHVPKEVLRNGKLECVRPAPVEPKLPLPESGHQERQPDAELLRPLPRLEAGQAHPGLGHLQQHGRDELQGKACRGAGPGKEDLKEVTS
jgi:predicted CXXCH cytochrome family protein